VSADGARTLTGAAELEAAGLYDPAAPDAAGQLALLEYMIGQGASIDDLVAAAPNGFPLLASRLALWGTGERLTLDEAADRLGVDRASILRTWRAAGFPEPEPNAQVFTPGDLAMFEIMGAGLEYLGEEVIIQLIRVLGAASARVADASISAFMVNVAPQALEQDPSGLALARANTDTIGLIDGMTRGFDTLVRHHIELGFRPGGPIELELAAGVDLVRRSVGFADLVGSTSWTRQLDFSTLSRALAEFETRASEIVVGRRGRLVKLIGDEVMFVAEEPVAAADIALALIETFASHPELPAVRAGIASGEVVARAGDYSGAVVNLAARALSVAEPSTLLVDHATLAAIDDDARFVIGAEREHVLKGFDAPVPLAVVTRAG
jgi:adenylate cyclase